MPSSKKIQCHIKAGGKICEEYAHNGDSTSSACPPADHVIHKYIQLEPGCSFEIEYKIAEEVDDDLFDDFDDGKEQFGMLMMYKIDERLCDSQLILVEDFDDENEDWNTISRKSFRMGSTGRFLRKFVTRRLPAVGGSSSEPRELGRIEVTFSKCGFRPRSSNKKPTTHAQNPDPNGNQVRTQEITWIDHELDTDTNPYVAFIFHYCTAGMILSTGANFDRYPGATRSTSEAGGSGS